MTSTTTERKQWTSTTGPRITKDFSRLLSRLNGMAHTVHEITDSGRFTYQTLGNRCEPIAALMAEVGERFNWTFSDDNRHDVTAAVEKAIDDAAALVPVVDKRTTPEERAEREAAYQEREAEREAERQRDAVEIAEHVEKLRKQYPWAKPDDGKISNQARAAANLRQELRRTFPGVKFSVKSSGFSMGDSVDYSWTMGPTSDEVAAVAGKYQHGHFCGMEDMYNDDRSNYGAAVGRVLGRSKYVHGHRDIPREVEEQIGRDLCAVQRVKYDGPNTRNVFGEGDPDYLQFHVRRILSRTSFPPGAEIAGVHWTEDGYAVAFEAPATPTPDPAPAAAGGYSVQKHHHTKRRVDYWLVVLADRVDRDTFNTLRDSCKAAGGWYSRQWGSTPGGFAFNSEPEAAAWAASALGGGDGGPDGSGEPEAKPRPTAATADRLRTMADRLQQNIDAGRRDRDRNTPKKNRQALQAIAGAAHAERVQSAMRKLADLHDAGEVPPLLAGFTTKAAIFPALDLELDGGRMGYYDYIETDKYRDTSPEAQALQRLITATRSPDEEAQHLRQREIDKITEQIRFAKIPGFFPTPPAIVSRLIEAADLSPGLDVLEPSAGAGAIADAIAAAGGNVTCCEISPPLTTLLQLRGYNVAAADFEHLDESDTFDRVIMNPPFERGQDIDHVMRAFDHLRPGGVLVAIVSAGSLTRSDRRAGDFRLWLDTMGADVESLPADAFKPSGTSVQTSMIVVHKDCEPVPHALPEPPCAQAMGCLCACHAAGLDAGEPCDTSEERARAIADEFAERVLGGDD